jgi:hypothetical protein
MSLVKFPLQTDREALVEAAYAFLEEQFPGWKPEPGNPEVVLIRGIIYAVIAPAAELAADVPDEIFNVWGTDLVNLPPHTATPATVSTTWTVQDTAGYTIKQGWEVDVPVTGDESQGFRVVSDVVIPPGKSATAAGEVLMEAINPGAAAAAIGTAGTVCSLVNAIGYVSTVKLAEATHGGEDAEEPAAYLSRLAETMRTLSPRPVIARDVEIIARNIAGVGRAVAIDNWNAETEAGEQEKTTSVYVTDSSGLATSAEVKAVVLADLQSKREANFLFFVRDATYTEVDVKTTIVEREGYEHAAVVAAVKKALEEFLSPANYGLRVPGEPQTWVNSPTLRYQDLVTVVNSVEGVEHYTLLESRKHSGSYGVVDITLSGKAPLPKVNTLTVT